MIAPDGSVVTMDGRLVQGNSSAGSVREYAPTTTTTTTTTISAAETPDVHLTSPQSPPSHPAQIEVHASEPTDGRRSSDPAPGESWFRSIFDHSPIQGLEPVPVDLSKRAASTGGDYLASVLSSMNELGSPGALAERPGESSPPSYATQRPFVDDSHRLRYQDIEDEAHSNEDSDEDDRRRPGNSPTLSSNSRLRF